MTWRKDSKEGRTTMSEAIVWMVQQMNKTSVMSRSTSYREQRVAELFRQGCEVPEIASELDISYRAVRHLVSKVVGTGAFERRRNQRVVERNKRVVADHKAGLSLVEIAKANGISESTTRRILIGFRQAKTGR